MDEFDDYDCYLYAYINGNSGPAGSREKRVAAALGLYDSGRLGGSEVPSPPSPLGIFKKRIQEQLIA